MRIGNSKSFEDQEKSKMNLEMRYKNISLTRFLELLDQDKLFWLVKTSFRKRHGNYRGAPVRDLRPPPVYGGGRSCGCDYGAIQPDAGNLVLYSKSGLPENWNSGEILQQQVFS